MELRPYQQKIVDDVNAAWRRGSKNVLAVLPTGGGKTVILSNIVNSEKHATCVIAHRQELVTQISRSLAISGVKHRIIGPQKIVKLAVKMHMSELGVNMYDPHAQCAVAGVDTLVRRGESLASWLPNVSLWVIDEAHHVLAPGTNKWGNATAMFPNARGLGVTATPERADGMGLGRKHQGVMDEIVEGPQMRQLIDAGYLTDYRIFAPASTLDLHDVSISKATGDYNKVGVSKAIRRSSVIGDVVDHYRRIAPGKLGITFATDVNTATEIANSFKSAGVAAEVISAKTPDADRVKLIEDFKNKRLMQLVNVDLFGEGFDLPALEVVSMARPTNSYALFAQQFGRSLRILEGKKNAIIIDHVSNVIRHGLPDSFRSWGLEGRKRNTGPKIPLSTCTACLSPYERIYKECPFCFHYEPPSERGSIEIVAGDLSELDAETLARMRGDVNRLDMDKEDYRAELCAKGAPLIGQMTGVKRHVEKQKTQIQLRESIALWAGHQRHFGRPDSESYRRFYFKFGIDVLSAQALMAKDANVLNEKIRGELCY